jgi:hypothetical protein
LKKVGVLLGGFDGNDVTLHSFTNNQKYKEGGRYVTEYRLIKIDH